MYQHSKSRKVMETMKRKMILNTDKENNKSPKLVESSKKTTLPDEGNNEQDKNEDDITPITIEEDGEIVRRLRGKLVRLGVEPCNVKKLIELIISDKNCRQYAKLMEQESANQEVVHNEDNEQGTSTVGAIEEVIDESSMVDQQDEGKLEIVDGEGDESIAEESKQNEDDEDDDDGEEQLIDADEGTSTSFTVGAVEEVIDESMVSTMDQQDEGKLEIVDGEGDESIAEESKQNDGDEDDDDGEEQLTDADETKVFANLPDLPDEESDDDVDYTPLLDKSPLKIPADYAKKLEKEQMELQEKKAAEQLLTFSTLPELTEDEADVDYRPGLDINMEQPFYLVPEDQFGTLVNEKMVEMPFANLPDFPDDEDDLEYRPNNRFTQELDAFLGFNNDQQFADLSSPQEQQHTGQNNEDIFADMFFRDFTSRASPVLTRSKLDLSDCSELRSLDEREERVGNGFGEELIQNFNEEFKKSQQQKEEEERIKQDEEKRRIEKEEQQRKEKEEEQRRIEKERQRKEREEEKRQRLELIEEERNQCHNENPRGRYQLELESSRNKVKERLMVMKSNKTAKKTSFQGARAKQDNSCLHPVELSANQQKMLQQQLLQHVQLLTQTHLMTRHMDELTEERNNSEQYLRELSYLHKVKSPDSFFAVPTLDDAITIIDTDVSRTPTICDLPTCQKKKGIPSFPLKACRLMASSHVFQFSQLLPTTLSCKPRKQLRADPMLPSEDRLLALGLVEMANKPWPKYQLIQKFMMPHKTDKVLIRRVNNRMNRADSNCPIFRLRRLGIPPAPVGMYESDLKPGHRSSDDITMIERNFTPSWLDILQKQITAEKRGTQRNGKAAWKRRHPPAPTQHPALPPPASTLPHLPAPTQHPALPPPASTLPHLPAPTQHPALPPPASTLPHPPAPTQHPALPPPASTLPHLPAPTQHPALPPPPASTLPHPPAPAPDPVHTPSIFSPLIFPSPPVFETLDDLSDGLYQPSLHQPMPTGEPLEIEEEKKNEGDSSKNNLISQALRISHVILQSPTYRADVTDTREPRHHSDGDVIAHQQAPACTGCDENGFTEFAGGSSPKNQQRSPPPPPAAAAVRSPSPLVSSVATTPPSSSNDSKKSFSSTLNQMESSRFNEKFAICYLKRAQKKFGTNAAGLQLFNSKVVEFYSNPHQPFQPILRSILATLTCSPEVYFGVFPFLMACQSNALYKQENKRIADAESEGKTYQLISTYLQLMSGYANQQQAQRRAKVEDFVSKVHETMECDDEIKRNLRAFSDLAIRSALAPPSGEQVLKTSPLSSGNIMNCCIKTPEKTFMFPQVPKTAQMSKMSNAGDADGDEKAETTTTR